MSQLYTVRMFRERRIYSYDERGRPVNERFDKLEVVVTDLPHVTALGYQFKFPNNDVKIEPQYGSDHTPVRTSKRDYYESDDEPAAPSAAKRDAMVDAAIRGDLGAAISEEVA